MLAAITEHGREVVERATADLMSAEFGLSCYDEDELAELTTVLRRLRVATGDF